MSNNVFMKKVTLIRSNLQQQRPWVAACDSEAEVDNFNYKTSESY